MHVQLLSSGRTVVAALRTADKASYGEVMGALGIQEGVQAGELVTSMHVPRMSLAVCCRIPATPKRILRRDYSPEEEFESMFWVCVR